MAAATAGLAAACPAAIRLPACGVTSIPMHTLSGDFNIWIRRVDNDPKLEAPMRHSGTGATPEYLNAFDKTMEYLQ